MLLACIIMYATASIHWVLVLHQIMRVENVVATGIEAAEEAHSVINWMEPTKLLVHNMDACNLTFLLLVNVSAVIWCIYREHSLRCLDYLERHYCFVESLDCLEPKSRRQNDIRCLDHLHFRSV